MVLKRIVEDKRLEVSSRRPDGWKLDLNGVVLSDRSLEQALRKPHTGFILECKKASPSKGLIRPYFDPEAIASAYEPFADAISVLTDEKYFQGNLKYLKQVRDVVSVPVICKDFVVEPFQVVEARQNGADAILLMLSVLDDEEFRCCFEVVNQLKMDALVEVRNEAELTRALDLGARIIGINNRNLDNLEVDLQTTVRLAPLVPEDKVVVSESGIMSHRDVRTLRHLANGFLVGSSIMKQADLTRACGELIYGKVKVCGLTREEDVSAVKAAGVRWGGLIFAHRSPRCVSFDRAKSLVRREKLEWVGVFVDEAKDTVIRFARELGLKAVQLHGMEDQAYMNSLKQRLPSDCEIWKALAIDNRVPDLTEHVSDRLLLDGKRAGSGVAFDWDLLEGNDMSRMLVAGGLSPENAEAADDLGAYGLDVNSGVETSPGVKNEQLLTTFLRNLRGQGRICS